MLRLRQFLRQDCRGVVTLLSEWSDLRAVLQLKKVPHYSTLCSAQDRLAIRTSFKKLPEALCDDAFAQGLADEPPEMAIDSTGFESRHSARAASCGAAGSAGTCGQRAGQSSRLACHTQSHLIAGAPAAIGPSQDSPQFPPVSHGRLCAL